MDPDLDLDHLKRWIGREEAASEALTPALIAQFNATFDRSFPAEPGAEAPLLIHFCLAQPTTPTAALGPDGHALRGGFLPPVPLPRRMWAGGAFTFHAPLRVGQTVRRRSLIRDVVLKQGRSGPLCFVTVEHQISGDGQPALTERHDIVYRGATGAPPLAADPAPKGDTTQTITPTAAYLFRYSAMTFNGHRIHYDTPYAREVEGYPGLIVHGPLQATLLVQMAADLKGSCPAQFTFRSLSTIFDTADFTLNAAPQAKGLRLWTAQTGGPVAMEAQALWA